MKLTYQLLLQERELQGINIFKLMNTGHFRVYFHNIDAISKICLSMQMRSNCVSYRDIIFFMFS